MLESKANTDLFYSVCDFLSGASVSKTDLYVAFQTRASSLAPLAQVSQHLYHRITTLPFWDKVRKDFLGLPEPEANVYEHKTSYHLVVKYHFERQEAQKRRCGCCNRGYGAPYPLKGKVPRNLLCDPCWGLPEFNIVNKTAAVREFRFSKKVVEECEFYEHGDGSHWIFVTELEKVNERLRLARTAKQQRKNKRKAATSL